MVYTETVSVTARHKLEPFGSGFLFLHRNTPLRGKLEPEGFFFSDSGTMRHVGGSSLNNPVTRANQSRDGGLRIEPGGSGRSFAYAPQSI